MTHNEAIEKVRKLLRLAKSNNEHEAALAASRAQDIVDRFKIETINLSLEQPTTAPDEPIRDFGFDPIDEDERRITWKIRLAATLAQQNQCKAYTSGGATCLIGRPTDVEMLRELYFWLSMQVEKLLIRECRGCTQNYRVNFAVGVVDTIRKRLKQQRIETIAELKVENPLAIVLIEKSLMVLNQRLVEVERWTQEHMNLRPGRDGIRHNESARAAGQRAGQNINLNPQRNQIGERLRLQ
jgi:hypothetical protein